MSTETTKQTTVVNQNQPIIDYTVKVFDGLFSEQEINTKRNYVFYRVANFESPRTKLRLNSVLSDEEIGEVINELSTLQFNRKLQARTSRAGNCAF